MTGGDIKEIKINHPTLGSKTFFAVAGETSTFDLGLAMAADESAGVDGGGRMIDTITNKRWFFEMVSSWDMNVDNELLFAQQCSASPVLGDITVSHINGTVWNGKGKPVGDLQGDGNKSTFTIKVAGGGRLKKII
jgi:hypothetical protein